MIHKIIHTCAVFLFLFASVGQAQIATKGIDLSYLQQLVRTLPDTMANKSPDSYYETTINNNFEQKTNLLKAGSDTFHINFIDIMTASELRMLSTKLDNRNYPLTLLHKGVFATYTQLLLEYDLLIYKYVELEKTSNTLKNLQQREIQELKNIADLEQQKSEIMRKSRDQIMIQSKYLNRELVQSLSIQKKQNRRDIGKKFLTGAIGGAVGFAVGVLFLEFAR